MVNYKCQNEHEICTKYQYCKGKIIQDYVVYKMNLRAVINTENEYQESKTI